MTNVYCQDWKLCLSTSKAIVNSLQTFFFLLSIRIQSWLDLYVVLLRDLNLQLQFESFQFKIKQTQPPRQKSAHWLLGIVIYPGSSLRGHSATRYCRYHLLVFIVLCFWIAFWIQLKTRWQDVAQSSRV